MPNDLTEINVLLQIYSSLRQEILQSISLQHRTLISESFFISIVFSIQLFERDPQSFLKVLVAVIPLFVIGFTALWLIDQSRMMRAGNYLQIIEDKINQELSLPCLTWENWLRTSPSGAFNIKTIDVQGIHHGSQGLIICLFQAMACYSLFPLWELGIMDEFKRHMLVVIYILLILIELWISYRVIFHRSTFQNKDSYYMWEKTYKNNLHICINTNLNNEEV